MGKELDHQGPVDGMCFLGLNFTHEQFNEISSAIVDRMDQKAERGVEGAIVAAFREAGRQRFTQDELIQLLHAISSWREDKLLAAVKYADTPAQSVFEKDAKACATAMVKLRAALAPQPVENQGGGE